MRWNMKEGPQIGLKKKKTRAHTHVGLLSQIPTETSPDLQVGLNLALLGVVEAAGRVNTSTP
jgi:hypothetical protein